LVVVGSNKDLGWEKIIGWMGKRDREDELEHKKIYLEREI
jgi:hypothetical protein